MHAGVELVSVFVRACGLLAASASVVWVSARGARLAADATIDRVLIGFVYSLCLTAGIVGGLGALRVLSPWSMFVAALAAGLAGRYLIGGPAEPKSDSLQRLLEPVRIPLLVTGAAALAAILPALMLAPTSWDAMTYHLYFPARWLDRGAIHHVPTVFGDNAPAFAPQNGALIHAWSMGLLSSDALAPAPAGLAICTVMVALWSVSRSMGAEAQTSAWVVGWTMLLPPVLRESVATTVDALTWSMWLVSFTLATRYATTGNAGLIAASGLALGFAAGTKTVAVPLAGMLAVAVMTLLLTRRAWKACAVYVGCAALFSVPWFLRNLLLYGNPIFPLDFNLGPLTFPGAYGTDAVRAGEFHISDNSALMAFLLQMWGAPTIVLGLIGVVFLTGTSTWSLVSRDGGRSWSTVSAAFLAVSWFGYYSLVVPHNAETRFAVPTLLLGICGWALFMSRLRRTFPAIAGIVLILVTLVLLPPYLRALRQTSRIANLESLALVAAVMTVAWVVMSVGRRRSFRTVVGCVSAAVLVVTSVRASESSRAAEYRRAFHPPWSVGYLYFAEADIPSATILYTGFNLPHTLSGPTLRHHVVYCNVSGRMGDGFYDFWRRDQRRHAYHKPGIYRDNPAFEIWMECVRNVSADYIAVFAMHPAERAYLNGDADGFPIERQWIRLHPELFVPIRRGPEAEIFAVLGHSGPP